MERDRFERRFFIISLVGYGILLFFTFLLAEPIWEKFYPLPTDQGASWYYWQLTETTTLAMITAWGGYLLHQFTVWFLIYRVIKSDNKRRANLQMLTANLFFVGLHLIQTFFWYDGLAQVVPIWVSQGSVIVMLILVLYMMLPRRGLFFGRKVKVNKSMMKFMGPFHGIFISWALVFTFWFHPMDGNWGMLSGFLYMFLLFIQLGVVNQRTHTNGLWVVILEAGVTVHGTLISLYKHLEAWPMFLFGFFIMFVLTQMYTLKLKKWVYGLFWALFIGSTIWVYATIRGFGHIYELTFIPVALYGGAAVLYLIDRIIEGRTKAAAD